MDTVNKIKAHLVIRYKFYLVIVALLSGFLWSSALAFDDEVTASTFEETQSATIAFTQTVAKYCPSPSGECTTILQPFIPEIEGVLQSVKFDICRFNGTGSGTWNIGIWNSEGGVPNEELATGAGWNIADLTANTSSGICTTYDTKTIDFSAEGINLTAGGEYYIAIKGIGAEVYTGKKGIQVSGADYNYTGNPKWSNNTATSFYPLDTSWNNYAMRFEVIVQRQILPDLPDYVFCLPHNYIPAGEGDEGDVLAIFSNLYQWIANTPVVGDLLFINCILFTEFYGELETTALIDPVFHLHAFGLDQDVDIPLSDTYDQIATWTSGIVGFSAFKTALTTLVWCILIFLIVKIFFFKGGGGVSVMTDKEEFNENLRSETQRRKDIDDLDID